MRLQTLGLRVCSLIFIVSYEKNLSVKNKAYFLYRVIFSQFLEKPISFSN